MPPPAPRSLAAVFLRYGSTTFGGGSATIGALHGEITTKRKWVTQQQFDLSYALSRLTPGTNLLAFATAIGWLTGSWYGAVVVLVAASIPSALLAVLLSAVYQSLTDHPLAMIALRGALAAAVGIVFATAWTIVRPHFKKSSTLKIIAFAVGAFLLATSFDQSPIRILIAAALVGVVLPTRISA